MAAHVFQNIHGIFARNADHALVHGNFNAQQCELGRVVASADGGNHAHGAGVARAVAAGTECGGQAILDGTLHRCIIAVEPASCPSLTRGVFKYDFCDTGMICPMAKMYTLGNGFIPSANHAGGLRYHGMSGIVSQLYHDGYLEARSVEQTSVFEAAEFFARCEGILPAPESSHAIRVAIDEAVKCRETGEEKTIAQ